MASLTNVRDEIRERFRQHAIAAELADAMLGLFTIEDLSVHSAYKWRHTILFCKPTKTIAESLLLNREVLAMITNVDDLQVRTLHVAKGIIQSTKGRLEPALFFVVHADPRGDEKLRSWGREQGYKIIPIYRSRKGEIPSPEGLKRKLSEDLFAYDPFSLTGPVHEDADFFGRKANATDTLRHLEHGAILSFFGIRKIGKTSLINRVISLARSTKSLNVAMIDCSVEAFYGLGAKEALGVVAKASRMAATRGYAHITEALKVSNEEILPVFDGLWSNAEHKKPLALIFDEVDYITPASPTAPHWGDEFNRFWREFRAVYQEAQRMNFRLSVLVSGVSSQAFKIESFGGVENAVLHFVPETYLSPFARQASTEMIKALSKRCGLAFSTDDRERIAEACGDFPYWIRLAGSFMHRELEVADRPYTVDSELVGHLLKEFVVSDGADVARVALEDLRRKYPESFRLLEEAAAKPCLSLSHGSLLLRYGLVSKISGGVSLQSAMVRSGVEASMRVREAVPAPTAPDPGLRLEVDEWAEELANVNRRRNQLERKLRELIHITLKLSAKSNESWVQKVLSALPEKQRAQLSPLSGDALLNKLYWKDICTVMHRNWEPFNTLFGDKKRFEHAMDVLNDRPDAHAKPVDQADLSLYRRELDWLDARLA